MAGVVHPRPIKLMPDYGCFPLWWDSTHPAWAHWGRPLGDIDPASLGISAALAADLLAWAEAFDAALNWDDPAAAPLATPEELRAFDAQAPILAARLAAELGETAVIRCAWPRAA